MTALLPSVFVASVIGSLHCAGMCGPLIAFYAGASDQHRRGVHVAYHLGRFGTYTVLGAIAGGVGQVANGALDWVGLGRTGAIVASVVMVIWGALLLSQSVGFQLFRRHGPESSASPTVLWVYRLASRAQRRPPLIRGALLGAASGLLPCGWLYAFVVTAAGAGSPALGALTMGTFWLGTVPALVLFAWGFGRLTAGLRRWVPSLSALALVALGVIGVFTRTSLASSIQRVSMTPITTTPSTTRTATPVVPEMPADCPMHRRSH